MSQLNGEIIRCPICGWGDPHRDVDLLFDHIADHVGEINKLKDERADLRSALQDHQGMQKESDLQVGVLQDESRKWRKTAHGYLEEKERLLAEVTSCHKNLKMFRDNLSRTGEEKRVLERQSKALRKFAEAFDGRLWSSSGVRPDERIVPSDWFDEMLRLSGELHDTNEKSIKPDPPRVETDRGDVGSNPALPAKCPECQGVGYFSRPLGRREECKKCGGSGGGCLICHGKGSYVSMDGRKPCVSCKGTGKH